MNFIVGALQIASEGEEEAEEKNDEEEDEWKEKGEEEEGDDRWAPWILVFGSTRAWPCCKTTQLHMDRKED